MSDELLPGPTKGACEGDYAKCVTVLCPLFGTLGRPFRDGKRRIRGCGDPAARGKRSRTKGDTRARKLRKKAAIAGVNSRHEEVWGGAFRLEVKAGAKANVVATAYKASEGQSESSRPFGDVRPFIAGYAPDGWSDELLVFRSSKQIEVAVAILANHGIEVVA